MRFAKQAHHGIKVTNGSKLTTTAVFKQDSSPGSFRKRKTISRFCWKYFFLISPAIFSFLFPFENPFLPASLLSSYFPCIQQTFREHVSHITACALWQTHTTNAETIRDDYFQQTHDLRELQSHVKAPLGRLILIIHFSGSRITFGRQVFGQAREGLSRLD